MSGQLWKPERTCSWPGLCTEPLSDHIVTSDIRNLGGGQSQIPVKVLGFQLPGTSLVRSGDKYSLSPTCVSSQLGSGVLAVC